MKEMIYTNNRHFPEQLASGTFLGYNYYVLSLGTHPCAYVEIPKNNKFFGKDYDDIHIACHGGLTYAGHQLATADHEGWFIGWDYAHYGDYSGCLPPFLNEGSTQYTTTEMVEDCKQVIMQIEYQCMYEEA